MRLKLFIMTFISVFLLASASHSDIYQYTDENGVRYFTDNILEVPEYLREDVRVHESIEPDEEETEMDESPELETGTDESLEKESPAEILIKLKEELAREYKELSQRKEAFENLDQDTDPEEKKATAEQLTKEIEAYNAKYKDYERQLIEFNSKVPSPDTTQKEGDGTVAEEETAPFEEQSE